MNDEQREQRHKAASRTGDIIRRAQRRGFEAASLAMAKAVGALDDADVLVRPLELDDAASAEELEATEADDGRVVSLDSFRK